MKTVISVIFSFLLLMVQAQESPYEKAMQNAYNKLQQAQMADEFIDAANTFERISQNETAEWLPLYYVAYSNIVTSYTMEDATQKEALLEKAQKHIDAALEKAPEESELHTLQAFLYPSLIMIDPMANGPVYVGKIYESLDKAERLNPENPRIYFLRAITLLNMPPEFGGGPEIAKPVFLKAKQKYDGFKSALPFSPQWGKEETEAELSKL
jgi:tetratricopeptide (TPR) repeat protein